MRRASARVSCRGRGACATLSTARPSRRLASAWVQPRLRARSFIDSDFQKRRSSTSRSSFGQPVERVDVGDELQRVQVDLGIHRVALSEQLGLGRAVGIRIGPPLVSGKQWER